MSLPRRAVARTARALVLGSLANVALASGAGAQRLVAPIGVHTVAAPPAALTAESRATVRVVEGRVMDRAIDGALYGALYGALAGVVVAFVHTRYGGHTNHDFDFVAYLIYPPLGALTGAIIGVVAGSERAP